jgi:hypothetical protein
MLTFFAALRKICANLPSLKLSANSPSLKSSDSVIIDDAETVGADLQRTNYVDMKKFNNCVNPLNIK